VIRRCAPSVPGLLVPVAALLATVVLGGCAGTGTAAREKTSQEWYDEGVNLAGKKKYDLAL